jgi:hypothetical protein
METFPNLLHCAAILGSSVFAPLFLMFETHVVCNNSSLGTHEALVRPTTERSGGATNREAYTTRIKLNKMEQVKL